MAEMEIKIIGFYLVFAVDLLLLTGGVIYSWKWGHKRGLCLFLYGFVSSSLLILAASGLFLLLLPQRFAETMIGMAGYGLFCALGICILVRFGTREARHIKDAVAFGMGCSSICLLSMIYLTGEFLLRIYQSDLVNVCKGSLNECLAHPEALEKIVPLICTLQSYSWIDLAFMVMTGAVAFFSYIAASVLCFLWRDAKRTGAGILWACLFAAESMMLTFSSIPNSHPAQHCFYLLAAVPALLLVGKAVTEISESLACAND